MTRHEPTLARPAAASRWHALRHSRRMRGRIYQCLAVLAVLAAAIYMGRNAILALDARGMQLGLRFLSEPSGFTLAESILPFTASDSFFHAFMAGLGNTLWVSGISLVLATLLGIVLGIARLSGNWLVSRIAILYIDIFRNTPQLIQIVFWYTLFTLLPSARQALHGGDWWYLSNRGFVMAWPEDTTAFAILWLALAAGLLGLAFLVRRCDDYQYRTGKTLPTFWLSTGALILFLFAVWQALGAPNAISRPHLSGFNFQGGATLSPEFLALAMGLVLYFAAYIAEIVRSGIASIPRGQIEAARALNINGARLYRRVILPQALRVIVPPVSAQYISLIKTSALGVAIGYPELFNVSNSVMTLSGHTLECVFIMGAVYLLLALVVSAIMNFINRKVALRGANR